MEGVTGAPAISKSTFRLRSSAGRAYCKRNLSKIIYKYLSSGETVPAAKKIFAIHGAGALCSGPPGPVGEEGA